MENYVQLLPQQPQPEGVLTVTTPPAKRNYPRHVLPSKMVAEFMQTFKQTTKARPEFPSRRVALLRLRLIVEELFELIAAMWRRDMIGIADALGDLVYVVVGMAHTYGIPFDEVFREIHSSNMSKAGPDGKAILRADGKIMKGEGYRPPDLRKVMGI